MVRNRAEGTFSRNWEALSRCSMPALGRRRKTERERWAKGDAQRGARGRDDPGAPAQAFVRRHRGQAETTDAILVQRVLQEMCSRQRGSEVKLTSVLPWNMAPPGSGDKLLGCVSLHLPSAKDTPYPGQRKIVEILHVKPLGAIPRKMTPNLLLKDVCWGPFKQQHWSQLTRCWRLAEKQARPFPKHAPRDPRDAGAQSPPGGGVGWAQGWVSVRLVGLLRSRPTNAQAKLNKNIPCRLIEDLWITPKLGSQEIHLQIKWGSETQCTCVACEPRAWKLKAELCKLPSSGTPSNACQGSWHVRVCNFIFYNTFHTNCTPTCFAELNNTVTYPMRIHPELTY